MVLSWLFRPQCAACGELSEDPLCGACRLSLVELDTTRTRDPWPLDRIIAPWQFGGALAIAIRRLKFAGATHVARTVAPLWAPLFAAAVAETGGVVVPVPLHWRRRFQRGFDQTWLLAKHACAVAGIAPPVCALRRTYSAPPQSTLPAIDRAANVDGAFALRGDAPRAVILIDDVVTTGATLAAAAQPLRDAGVETIIGIALARAD